MKIQAFRDEIIVDVITSNHQANSNFVIPSSSGMDRYHGDVCGKVLAIGPEYPHDLKIGDYIIFQRHEGKPLTIGDKKYFALKERWVMGVLESPPPHAPDEKSAEQGTCC